MNSPDADKIDKLIAIFSRLLKLALDDNPLDSSGISAPQLALLDWIAAHPGCGVRDIAEGLAVTAPTVSVSVRRLEEHGLLNRSPNPDDGRSVQFSLSEDGMALYQRALAFRRAKMRQLLSQLSGAEADVLLALLRKATSASQPHPDQTR